MGFVHFIVLCFSLSAKRCSHLADRLAGEMYLLTSIDLAVLLALTSQGTPVNETSFTMNESTEKRIFVSIHNTTIEQYLSNILTYRSDQNQSEGTVQSV